MRCRRGIECIVRLIKSARIADDLAMGARKLFVVPWNDDIARGDEYRVFVVDHLIVAASPIPDEPQKCPDTLIDYRHCLELAHVHSQCAIDVYVYDGATHVIEVNPLDAETDLYTFDADMLERKIAQNGGDN